MRPLLENYVQEKLGIEPEFIYLRPASGSGGIDHWNHTLELVEKLELKLPSTEPIYVSHQAGTPAVSAAVQFISISRSDQAKFLLSNQTYSEDEKEYKPELVPSSRYWRGLQVQKAKKLIIDGLPGAALTLLKEIKYENQEQIKKLTKLVAEFNIRAEGDRGDEFNPERAIARVRRALDLIEIFFQQENYLQGVLLLAAAQETFVKAGIIAKVQKIEKKVGNLPVKELVVWDNEGLKLSPKKQLENNSRYDSQHNCNLDLAELLKFPIPQEKRYWPDYVSDSQKFTLKNIKGKRFYKLNNGQMLKWLKNLGNFPVWPLLTYSFNYNRQREQDLRNQLIHNLRGVQKEDLISYLLNGKKEKDKSAMEVYQGYVKEPFIKALWKLNLWNNSSTDNFLKEKLKDVADSLK